MLDADKKWHCYVCYPEPLVRLVLACDTTLQNLQNGGTRRARLDPQRAKILALKGQQTPTQTEDSEAPLSTGLLQRTQRLVEMTMALNQSFVQFMQVSEEDNSDEEEERTIKLKDYSNVPVDLQNAYNALQHAVEMELRRCGQEDPRTLYTSSEQEHPASQIKEGQTSSVGDEEQEDERGIQPMDEESRCSLWVQQTPLLTSTDTSVEGSGIFELEKSSSPDLERTSIPKSKLYDQSPSPSYSSSSSSSRLTTSVQPRPRGRPRKRQPKSPGPVELSSHSSSSDTGGCGSESGCDSDFKDQHLTTKGVSPLNARTFQVLPSEYDLVIMNEPVKQYCDSAVSNHVLRCGKK